MKPKVCFVVNTDWFVNAFLSDQLNALSKTYELTLVGNFSNGLESLRDGFPGRVISIPIARDLSPLRDAHILAALVRLFLSERFTVVHSMQPKAGLLAMLAAWLTRVPIRIHTMTGQVWVTRKGWMRWLLRFMDRVLSSRTTRLLTDSPSQRDFIVAQDIAPAEKVVVLGSGSVSGVDLERFRPDPAARSDIRTSLGIPAEAAVLLFVGRMSRDKGIFDLIEAFRLFSRTTPDVHLVLVGPDEGGVRTRVQAQRKNSRIHFVDYTPAPQRYMAAADVFCLPSYREGFGTVIIEAAATGVPSVASRIYGILDAVVDGTTGLLHTPGDVDDIYDKLTSLIASPELRQRLAHAARERVQAEFSRERLTRALCDFYASQVTPVPVSDHLPLR